MLKRFFKKNDSICDFNKMDADQITKVLKQWIEDPESNPDVGAWVEKNNKI